MSLVKANRKVIISANGTDRLVKLEINDKFIIGGNAFAVFNSICFYKIFNTILLNIILIQSSGNYALHKVFGTASVTEGFKTREA